MDTLQHGVAGLALSRVFGLSVEESIVIAIAGGGADIIGWVGRKLGDENDWSVYNQAHSFENFSYGCVVMIALMLLLHSFVPILCAGAYGLHLLLDSFTHTKGREWWVWKGGTLWAEILVWAVLVTYFVVSYT